MHKQHSAGKHWVGSLAWLVTALGALAWGLLGLGTYLGQNWNIWETDLIARNLPWLVLPAQLIIGALGLVSLVFWFMCLGAGCCTEHDHDHKR